MSFPSFSRRSFLIGTGVVAVPVVLAGCGFTQQSSPEGRQGTLTFTTWGTDAELAGFRAAIAAFEAANEGSSIELNAVPYEQMFTNIDAQLQAGNPPDVFRVPYYTFGAYAGREQLLDLGPLLSADRQDQFTPQAWAAVQSAGSTYGLPHHTDTSAILVNRDLFAAAGITEIPETIEDAWTWEELAEIGDRLKAGAESTAAFDWTATYAPRNVRGGGDFGGNALVATAQTQQPELAAAFLEFVTDADPMRDFCRGASLLPTRADLLNDDLEFDVRSELAPIFAAQAGVVQPQDVAQVASPSMSAIIPVLKEQLDLAFAGSQDAATTVANLQSGIAAATGA